MISTNTKTLILGSCALCLCLAITTVSSQYKDSDGRTLSQSELARLMRSSSSELGVDGYNSGNERGFGASRQLYNRQQPLQYAPSYNKRSSNYGPTDGLAGYGFGSGASSAISRSGRANNNNDEDDDDDTSSNFGPSNSFESNEDAQNAGADGSPMNLNQAASGGYPSQGNYNSDNSNDNSGFGPSGFDGSEFGPSSDEFGSGENSGRLRQAGSSSASMRNHFGAGSNDEDAAGIPAYNPGPNSAVNSDDADEDSRASSQDGGEDDD